MSDFHLIQRAHKIGLTRHQGLPQFVRRFETSIGRSFMRLHQSEERTRPLLSVVIIPTHGMWCSLGPCTFSAALPTTVWDSQTGLA